MPRAAVRTDIHQALDVHRDFGAQCTFDAMIALNFLTELVDVDIVQIANPLRRFTPAASIMR